MGGRNSLVPKASHWLSLWLLTQGWRDCAACDKSVVHPVRVCMCCLAFKHHRRTARSIGGNTVASSSNYLWEQTGFWYSCHYNTWHLHADRRHVTDKWDSCLLPSTIITLFSVHTDCCWTSMLTQPLTRSATTKTIVCHVQQQTDLRFIFITCLAKFPMRVFSFYHAMLC